MGTKIILQDDVINLGSVGDIVTVKDGYARNYLVPRKLAVAASDKNVRQLEHHKRIADRKRMKNLKTAEDFARRLGQISLKIARKVGEQDKLFGSVNTADIAEALAAQGVVLDKRKIHLPEPIKALGEFTVSIKLVKEIEANVKVSVVAEQ